MAGEMGYHPRTEVWLRRLQETNWFSSATHSSLAEVVEQDLVAVGLFGQVIRVSQHLVTNALFCSFLNSLPFENDVDTTYRWCNTYLVYSGIKRANSTCFCVDLADGRVTQRILTASPDARYAVVPGQERHPVVGVNWYGAELFVSALGGRLPTVAEWQQVAELGAQGPAEFPWGDASPSPERANYDEYVGSTSRVGAYPPSSQGLYDLAGNVREWCTDPGVANTGSHERPTKGGSWNKPAANMKVAFTSRSWLRHSSASVGFRLWSRPGTRAGHGL